MTIKRGVVAVALAMGLGASTAMAGPTLVEFEFFKIDSPGSTGTYQYGWEIWVGVDNAQFNDIWSPTGAVAVTMPDMTVINLTYEETDLYEGLIWYEFNDADEQTYIRTGYGSLVDLNAAIAGDWHVDIVTGKGAHGWGDCTLNALPDSDFLPVPTITSPTDGADDGPGVMMQWNHNGAEADALEMFAELEDADGTWQEMQREVYFGDPKPWPTSWMPDFVPAAGPAEAIVAYGRDPSDLLAGDPTAGGDDLNWDTDPVLGFVASVDVVDFNVVPEPATVALLAVGSLAALRRTRRHGSIGPQGAPTRRF